MGVEEYAPASAYRGLLPISPAKPRKAPERGLAYYLGPDVMGALNRSADLATALSPIDDYRYSADGFGKMLADDSDWLDRVAGFGEGILGAAMFASPAVTAALLDDATRAGIKAAAESRPAQAVDDAMSWVDDQGRMFARDETGALKYTRGAHSGSHTAPVSDGYSAPLHDLAGDIYPDDIYSDKAWHYYGHGDWSLDKQTTAILKRFRGKPDAPVKIYRAVPKGVEDIHAGDWVTINRNYAKAHGESQLGGNYDIVEETVPAGELFTDGNSIHEFGWSPRNTR